MSDQEGIGRPGYSADRARRAGPMRPVPPAGPADAGGVWRVRAVVAAALVVYAWLWLLGWWHTPLWTSLWAAGAGIRLGTRSRDPDAAAASVALANIARPAGGLYLIYALSVPAWLYFGQHAGVGTLLGYLLSS